VAGYSTPTRTPCNPTDIDPSQARLVISHELVPRCSTIPEPRLLVELKRRTIAARRRKRSRRTATLAQILVLMPEQKIESLPNFWTCERPGAQQDQMKVFGAHRCGCGRA